MTPFQTLQQLRKMYSTPMKNIDLGELLNAVAWEHRAEGYGLLYKPQGASTVQPGTGKRISKDILMLKDGRIFDCLIDSDGAAVPTWAEKEPVHPDKWVAPFNSEVVLPPPEPPEPLPPQQPYPDEPTWWKEFEQEQERLYTVAGHGLDWAAFRWSARTAYDIGAGMDKDKAKAKHLAVLKKELGL